MNWSIFFSLTVVLLSQSAFTQKCLMPMNIGNCGDLIPKYYYNNGTNFCESFEYSGCGGNANNFDSLLQCELECVLFEESPMQSSLPNDIPPVDTQLRTDSILTSLPTKAQHPNDFRRRGGDLVDGLRGGIRREGRGRRGRGGRRGGRRFIRRLLNRMDGIGRFGRNDRYFMDRYLNDYYLDDFHFRRGGYGRRGYDRFDSWIGPY